MQMLAGEADNINEDDPRQAADLMRKLTHMTGMELGSGMEEALSRMESGEDPESVVLPVLEHELFVSKDMFSGFFPMDTIR